MTQSKIQSKNDNLARERIISLVFGLLGVVQGLAFTKLAERFPTTFDTFEFSPQILSKMVYFFVGFLIVARVFQTFACGIIAYTKVRTDAWGLYGLFFAGICEYARNYPRGSWCGFGMRVTPAASGVGEALVRDGFR